MKNNIYKIYVMYYCSSSFFYIYALNKMVTSRDSFYKRVHFKGWVHSFQIPPLPNIGAQPEKKMQKKKKKITFPRIARKTR